MRQGGVLELTPRQRQVLRLAATGATYKEIASRLGVTSKTARNHLTNLYGQLGVHNRAQAVMYALRLGLVDLPQVATQAQRIDADPVNRESEDPGEANASSTSRRSTANMVVLDKPAHRRP